MGLFCCDTKSELSISEQTFQESDAKKGAAAKLSRGWLPPGCEVQVQEVEVQEVELVVSKGVTWLRGAGSELKFGETDTWLRGGGTEGEE